jgi:voltage-gated potassium channel
MKSTKDRLYEIIFEADTRAGKIFDLVLLSVILGSVVLVMLESVHAVNSKYNHILKVLEWVITILFFSS